jgi:hypothetical protein
MILSLKNQNDTFALTNIGQLPFKTNKRDFHHCLTFRAGTLLPGGFHRRTHRRLTRFTEKIDLRR